MSEAPKLGVIGWCDLTVENADQVRDFYAAVAGWTAEPLDMGGYADYVMKNAAGDAVAGICHARGPNTGIPPVWMVCITVKDLDACVAKCLELGGKVVSGPRSMGGQAKYAAIQDPSGAYAALYQAG